MSCAPHGERIPDHKGPVHLLLPSVLPQSNLVAILISITVLSGLKPLSCARDYRPILPLSG